MRTFSCIGFVLWLQAAYPQYVEHNEVNYTILALFTLLAFIQDVREIENGK